jgi:hypothetical protein
MGNTVNILIIYVTISVVLYAAQVTDAHGMLFGDDLITKWVEKDTSGEITSQYSDNLTESSDKVMNPFGGSSSSGTSFFNFWDILQILWDFVKMIFNIFLSVPVALLGLSLPLFMKIFIVLMLIIGFSVFALGMLGKR